MSNMFANLPSLSFVDDDLSDQDDPLLSSIEMVPLLDQGNKDNFNYPSMKN